MAAPAGVGVEDGYGKVEDLVDKGARRTRLPVQSPSRRGGWVLRRSSHEEVPLGCGE